MNGRRVSQGARQTESVTVCSQPERESISRKRKKMQSDGIPSGGAGRCEGLAFWGR